MGKAAALYDSKQSLSTVARRRVKLGSGTSSTVSEGSNVVEKGIFDG